MNSSPNTGLPVKIPLDLSTHCVQTAIRRCYNQRLSACFKPGDRSDDRCKQLESEIDLLVKSLETLDFNHLRSSNRDLAGHSGAIVLLERSEENRITITVNGEIIFETQ